MVTKHQLTDEEALAIVEDESTVWGPPLDNSDQVEIRVCARLVEQAEQLRDEAVLRARRSGLVWICIGDALGISAEAARKKYNSRV